MTGFWECLLKTSAFTLVVWIAAILLRRRSAALRHSLWICAVLAFAVVPALNPLSHRTPPMQVNLTVPTVLAIQPVVSSTAMAAPERKSSIGVLPWVWLAGTLLLLIRRSRASLRMIGITRRATRSSTDGVMLSDEVRAPLTWGFLSPVILLPACATEWPQDRLDAVLAHEREHIRRRDALWHWLGELVCAGWWFHPLAWLARNRAAHERECACDDAVIRSGVRGSEYASELLNLASTLTFKGEPVMALSALSDFERRIKNLVSPGIDRRPLNVRVQLATALTALAVIIPLAILRAQTPGGQADLSGTVVDASGAVVPNAVIIASSTGNREITRADSVGHWTFSGIPAGNYTIEAQSHGFAISRKTIALQIGQKATMDVTLELGQAQETINVIGQGQPRRTVQDTSAPHERIRVGGNVQAANLIRQVKPVYPDVAKAQGIEGTVLMKAIIGKDGNLMSVTVLNKLADPDLAAAAVAAVEQWRFKPTLLNGEPVEIVTTITMNFTLQD